MSWAAYVKNMLEQARDESQQHGDKGCIFDRSGDSNWSPPSAEAPGMCIDIQPRDMKVIASCIGSGDFTPLLTSGMHIEGVKYNVLRANMEDGIYGKRKESGAVWIKWSNKAIVMCHVTEAGQAGKVCNAVHSIVEYLKSMGY